MSNLTNYRITHSLFFCLFNHNTHPLGTTREPPTKQRQQALQLMKNVFEKAKRKSVFFFEENNYIIEPRQMLKYFYSMLGLFDK